MRVRAEGKATGGSDECESLLGRHLTAATVTQPQSSHVSNCTHLTLSSISYFIPATSVALLIESQPRLSQPPHLLAVNMADDASVMSASTSSLSPSKLCSKTYKKASQLFLTRRLQEALVSLEPVITAKNGNDDQDVNGVDSVPPIGTVPATWRIKIWNLYVTLLSAIIDLGPEEGKAMIGQKEWKDISTQVRDGTIWEKVVQIGYQGREGSIDAEVVYNL